MTLAPGEGMLRAMLTATSRSVPGTLRQELLVDGRHRLATDEPPSLGGEGSAPAPHELLPAALAACIGTTIALYARTKDWDLGEVTVDVFYNHRATPRTFEIEIAIEHPIDDLQRVRLEKVAATCPLRRSLETGFAFTETIRRLQPA
jgi:putative redox protein